MTALTQSEIDNLPPPPQEWLDEIEIQKSLNNIDECYDENGSPRFIDIRETIKYLFKLNMKQLRVQFKQQKAYDAYQKERGFKMERNGKITKHGLIINMAINWMDIDFLDVGYVAKNFQKGIIYLVDTETHN